MEQTLFTLTWSGGDAVIPDADAFPAFRAADWAAAGRDGAAIELFSDEEYQRLRNSCILHPELDLYIVNFHRVWDEGCTRFSLSPVLCAYANLADSSTVAYLEHMDGRKYLFHPDMVQAFKASDHASS